MSRLNGKVALVSGGARGIGAAIVKGLVSQGAQVVFGDILDEEGQALAREIGADTTYIHFDVTKPEEWEGAAALAMSRYGKLNVLVNNAAIDNGAPIEEFSLVDWRRVIDINLVGSFNGIRAVIPMLKESQGGSIINVSSIAGFIGLPESSAYVTSKFGMRGLTKSAALDLGKYNIRVNSVHPGYIRTPMTAVIPDEVHNAYPIARKGEPEEVANMVVFLASDESSYSTGSEFIVDGGRLVGRTNEFEL